MSARIDEIISRLTTRQKIGQLLILGWQGETDEDNVTVSEHARLLVEDFEVGGVVLLGRNIGAPEQTARTMNELQERSKIPVFIIADQEGGMVARLRAPAYVVFPSNMALGATGDPEYAYKAARATAEQLLATGINFDFAPCVDVNNNPLNPIIGTRSYGDNPEIVSRFAQAAIRGFHDGGVPTSVKHFPGHGDTSVDSHLALPVVDFPMERLEAMELVPFLAAIEAGVASIMTTHIIFPALDPELPATMSPRILTGLLREKMGWQGLIVTDCLEMDGVAVKWGTAKAALAALKAGADCPLICHTLSRQQEAHALISAAVESGELPMERVDQSVRRVLELKERFGLLEPAKLADPAKTASVAGAPEYRALALEIARKAVTVIKNERGILPARVEPGSKVLVVSTHRALPDLTEAIRRIHPNTDSLAVDTSTPAIEPGSDVRLIIAATCPNEPWTAGTDQEGQARMVKQLNSLGLPLVVLAIREPYDIRRFPEVETYLCSFGYREESLQAAAEVILGVTQPTGQLPVRLG
jgi:beta-N-acetylhexosaminidase